MTEQELLKETLEAYKDLVASQNMLLVVYRCGSAHRADAALNKMERAKARIARLEKVVPA